MAQEPTPAPLHNPTKPGELDPERPTTPEEDAGQSIEELDDPPQAEGQRDRPVENK